AALSLPSPSRHGPPGVKFMSFSKDGKIFIVVTQQSVRTWNIAGASEKLILEGHAGGIPDVVFSPDGKLLASAGRDHQIKIWDPVTGRLLKTLTEFATPVQTLCFSPDGRILAAGDQPSLSTSDHRGTVRFYDVESWKELLEIQPQVGPTHSIAFSPDGKHFAAAGRNGLRLWGARRGLPFQRLDQLSKYVSSSVCFSGDGNWLAWVGSSKENDGNSIHVQLWDLRSSQGHALSTARPYYLFMALDFYPDNTHLAFVSDKEAIAVWDVNT